MSHLHKVTDRSVRYSLFQQWRHLGEQRRIAYTQGTLVDEREPDISPPQSVKFGLTVYFTTSDRERTMKVVRYKGEIVSLCYFVLCYSTGHGAFTESTHNIDSPVIATIGAHSNIRQTEEEEAGFSPIKAMASGRRACGLYIWNAPSALLYKWTNHLLQDCIYEGKGGRKFVRFQPNSILQLLYPHVARYSPDSCLICGGSFNDHLALWWSKHLYTPFDLWLDRVNKAAEVEDPEKSSHRTMRSKGSQTWGRESALKFCFHGRYVLETSLLTEGVPRKSDQQKLVRRAVTERYPTSTIMERRMARGSKVSYMVPALTSEGKESPFILRFVRGIALNAMDSLVYLEEKEDVVVN